MTAGILEDAVIGLKSEDSSSTEIPTTYKDL
jgi:hypothetical protein